MPRLVPIVEGHGEGEAVPILLRKILQDQEQWVWQVARPWRVGSIGAFRLRLEQTLLGASREKECGALLILLDLDDGCPKTTACDLSSAIRCFNLPVPVAIAFAHREYEAWFLASIATIAGYADLPVGLRYDGEVEGRRGVKEWLTKQMPPGFAYKETSHQAELTAHIDLETAFLNSRSFRRLVHAVEELTSAYNAASPAPVTPLCEEPDNAP